MSWSPSLPGKTTALHALACCTLLASLFLPPKIFIHYRGMSPLVFLERNNLRYVFLIFHFSPDSTLELTERQAGLQAGRTRGSPGCVSSWESGLGTDVLACIYGEESIPLETYHPGFSLYSLARQALKVPLHTGSPPTLPTWISGASFVEPTW